MAIAFTQLPPIPVLQLESQRSRGIRHFERTMRSMSIERIEKPRPRSAGLLRFHGGTSGRARRGHREDGINIPVAGNKPVGVGNSPGVDCNRVRQTADRKGHGAWVARHTNCCWA